MFDNIGGKLKGLAEFCAFACVICGFLIAVIGLINYISNKDYIEYASVYVGAGYKYESLTEAGNKAYTGLQMIKYGIVTAVLGLINSWPLYGFGELVENSQKQRKKLAACEELLADLSEKILRQDDQEQ